MHLSACLAIAKSSFTKISIHVMLQLILELIFCLKLVVKIVHDIAIGMKLQLIVTPTLGGAQSSHNNNVSNWSLH